MDPGPAAYFTHRLKPSKESGTPEEAVEVLAAPTDHERKRFEGLVSGKEWESITRKSASRRLHYEIRGCKRLLWLYFVNAGQDVTVLRPSAYHHDEFMGLERWKKLKRPAQSHTDYLRWLYRILKSNEGLDWVLRYTRALVAAWGEINPGRTHEGAAFLDGVDTLIDRMCGVEVAA